MGGQTMPDGSMEILRCVVGSSAHGLHLEGTDDRDEMAVVIPPASRVIGLREWDVKTDRTQPEGVRSGPGDLDLVSYSLRKFCKLASSGNPTVLSMFYAPIIEANDLGLELRQHDCYFVSQQVRPRYLGYMHSQKERLLGVRGQMKVKRSELVERHGYDTKYAMHVVRLGLQGVEILSTGKLTLPMTWATREIAMDVRLGKMHIKDVIDLIEELEDQVRTVASDLPDEPDFAAIDDLLVVYHQGAWSV